MATVGLGRRAFLGALGGGFYAAQRLGADSRKPNVILLLADDLGYGDLGSYGSSIPTPNLDRMAQEGARLTRFYSAAPVCSPSRAALLTGRYPVRTGVTGVLMPDGDAGLQPTETSIPKVLKQSGYRTACVGKWHLGNKPQFMPLRHGFDEFYGVPYSNDMSPLPILRNGQVVTDSTDQASLTDRFTDQAIDFVRRNKDNPFFLYLAYTAPHIPLVAAERFRGKSGHGIYGDMVMELDWSVGEILKTVRESNLDENTLIVFTSDNGPWYQGSTGNLQGRKGSTYEGGVREPMIARMPGAIPAGKTFSGIGSTMDLLPTVARLAGVSSFDNSSVDGVDLWPMLSGDKPYVDRDILLFFDGWQIQCVRWGPWKLHLARYNSFAWTPDPPNGRWNLPLPKPELYNVDEDPGENFDMAPEKPQLVTNLKARVEELLFKLPDQVRSAWRDTIGQKIQDTPTGALPRRTLD